MSSIGFRSREICFWRDLYPHSSGRVSVGSVLIRRKLNVLRLIGKLSFCVHEECCVDYFPGRDWVANRFVDISHAINTLIACDGIETG